tara:strand:+ start:304 stop:1179 length:876 start_codon:yes stop_codon:yes gene_type:complete
MSSIPHLYEAKVKEYLSKLSAGEAPPVDDSLIDQACADFKAALIKQFNREGGQKFRVRMSNAGRAKCQLWFQKNHPEKANKPSYDFIMKMLLGDVIEVLALLLMRGAGIPIESYHGKVTLDLDGSESINGEYDVVIDGKVWDIKSSSPFAFEHKFKDFETVRADDSFGYMAQGFGYAKASGMPFGGWIVINKSTGEWKFVEADNNYSEEYTEVIQDTVDYIATDGGFERCYEDIDETFRKVPTGNKYIAKNCMYCDFKFSCWPTLQYRRVAASQAKNKPWRYYTVYTDDVQ